MFKCPVSHRSSRTLLNCPKTAIGSSASSQCLQDHVSGRFHSEYAITLSPRSRDGSLKPQLSRPVLRMPTQCPPRRANPKQTHPQKARAPYGSRRKACRHVMQNPRSQASERLYGKESCSAIPMPWTSRDCKICRQRT